MTEKWRRPQFALVVADRNETYTELAVPKLLLKKKTSQEMLMDIFYVFILIWQSF